jgi:ribonuclease E
MRMLMPSHARNVKLYPDTQPLLSRYGVENQLDAMFSPVVQLRSGGYIVLNQAEALVAIDVNSGRATREHHIEDTALKTNLEAADEIARQLRLRDLAGLIVIDFIDMEEKRNNRSVERRMKECLKQDRARIQVGRISHFGLLEMSRQRIRASVLESSTEKCPYCGGSGHVRSVSSLALQVLRALEEHLMRSATHSLIARTRPDVALYVLNQKRAHLRSLEERFAITITVSADESVRAPQAFVIERGEQVHTPEAARALAEKAQPLAVPLEEEDDLEEPVIAEGEAAEEQAGEDSAEQREAGSPRRRRRRRGRGGREERQAGGEAPLRGEAAAHETADEAEGDGLAEGDREMAAGEDAAAEPQDDAQHRQDRDNDRDESRDDQQGERRRRRRGRRGGRRNRHERDRNGDNGRDLHGQGEEQPHGALAPADLDEPAGAEPELSGAVADLDAAPQDAAFPPAPYEAPFESPVPVQSAEVVAPAAEAETSAPQRRSTVREAAPVSTGNEGSAPPPVPPPAQNLAPEPVITEVDEGESANRPRRTGWWSRRSAGG